MKMKFSNRKSVIVVSPNQSIATILLISSWMLASFPTETEGQNSNNKLSQLFRDKNSSPAIYINPNPSTTRSRTQQQRQVTNWPNELLGRPELPVGQQDMKSRLQRAPSSDISSDSQVTSGIGRSDQVADWPFFKSLISSRNNNQQANSNQKSVSFQSKSSPPVTNPSRAPTPGARMFETRAPEDPDESSARSATTTTSPTTSTTSTTTSAPISTQAPPTTTESLPESTSLQTTSDTTTLTYSSETTTTTAPTTATVTQKGIDPLFLPDFHSSLQQAVDRIVKMSLGSTTAAPQHSKVKPASLRSSLSLNVLLKNFGVHNLTNLDQIMLKSSLTDKGHDSLSRTNPNPTGEQHLSISGLHNIMRKSGEIVNSEAGANGTGVINLIMDGGANPDESGSKDTEGAKSAECKIEYTLKHANISLINESGSDYTCDYIIDRRLTMGRGKQIDMKQVCKLRLTSGFFSNETEPSCDGTHLSIGASKYCYLGVANDAAASLDRVFEFPVNEDAFDVKLIHKHQMDKDSSQLREAAEIHLEIKPLAEDKDCSRYGSSPPPNQVAPNVEYDVVETMPETQSPLKNMQFQPTTPSTITSTPEPPGAVSSNNQQDFSRESKRLRSPMVEIVAPQKNIRLHDTENSNRNRKFSLKVSHDNNNNNNGTNKLHPLNNRFKVSQSFDVGNGTLRPKHYSSDVPRGIVQSSQHQQHRQVKLCDTFKHVSSAGQLMTSEYPNYYQANTNCSFIIKRASIAYCKLLLHFRDFDLINNDPSKDQADCLEDYLQIGDTRYCNRYAMIGHKMRLNFTEMDNYSIRLQFNTDHKQSGRGFLIKYQQLLCSDSDQSSKSGIRTASNLPPTPRATEYDEPIETGSGAKTIAPPMQQPDFSFVGPKTTPISLRKPDPSNRDTKSAGKINQEETKMPTDKQEASSTNSVQMQPMASTISSALSLSRQASDLSTTTKSVRRSSHSGERRQCNQVNSELSFLLKSSTVGTNSSGNYENNLQCLYYVRRNSSRVCYLELTFIKFDLEADSDCRYDYLEINNVRLCGLLRNRTTRIYLFNEPIKVIRFNTDQSGSKSGFLIQVDQLECAQNGSIQRQAKRITQQTIAENDTSPTSAISSSSISNSTRRMFEYDALTITKQGKTLQPEPISGYSIPNTDESSSLSSTCDELLYGPEIVIRSPQWPESYQRPGQETTTRPCRYTILRNSAVGDKICQLELRFINLRLGPSDCIDIVGHELLCGFNARHMLRYYQFGESQTHLLIRFLPDGAGLKARNAATSPGSGPSTSGDEKLPHQSGPFRFMLVAKQHECIDGFLSSPINRTNLLYSHRDSGSQLIQNQSSNKSSIRQQDRTWKPDSVLRYDFSNTQPTLKQVNSSNLPKMDEPNHTRLIDRIPLMANHRRQQQHSNEQNADDRSCSIQFSQYNGIVSSASVLQRLRLSQRNECELKFKLLPGFCRVQLTFGEFELDQRVVGLCLGDYLEIDKFRYCSTELRNTSRLLIGSPLENFLSIKFVSSGSSSGQHGFRAIFKQIECNPTASSGVLLTEPTLRPVSQLESTGSENPTKQLPSSTPERAQSSNQSRSLEGSQAQVLFKEIVIRSEFFELNVANLSTGKENERIGYGPNMFIAYRVKRVKPEVCKLRLMFYRFDLEPSVGCKRDFLDINNVDRLCGRLEKAEDTRRDYNWPPDRDFLISFVSDSSIQAEGILLFGQQLLTDPSCNPTNVGLAMTGQAVHQKPTGIFDEDSQSMLNQEGNNNKDRRTNQASQVMASNGDGDVDKNGSRFMNSGWTAEGNAAGNCYKLFYEDQFNISSPNWPQQYEPETTCYYLIHKARPGICSVTFNILSMILDINGDDETPCDPARNIDHLDIDGRIHCGLISGPKSVTVDFGRRQFITVKFSSTKANGFGFYMEAKQNNCSQSSVEQVNSTRDTNTTTNPHIAEPPAAYDQQPTIDKSSEPSQTKARCNELIVDEISLIESEHFPANYKHNQDCLFVVRRQNQSICAIDLTLDHFELDGQSSVDNQCDGDYLEIDYSRFCGQYPAKHRLRFNYFADELDKLIKFHSDAAMSRSGFSITVKQISDCGQINHRDQSDGEIISYLPDSSTNKQQESKAPQLDDANQDNSPASNRTEPDNKSAQPQTLCQFTYHKDSQYLVSPNYNDDKLQYDNNVDCLYRIRAKSYEICSLKLTFVDLDLEQSNDCVNDYLLLDNRRYCGHGLNHLVRNKEVEVQFSDSLPREIHLLYHTNAHVNEGRGFKLHYEQQPCDKQDEQRFQLQNGDMRMDHLLATSGSPQSSSGLSERQTRRMKFGQLDYPKNYISESLNKPKSIDHETTNKKVVKDSRPDMASTNEMMTIRHAISVANARDYRGSVQFDQ